MKILNLYENGTKVVFIHDIIFKKKQYVEWKDVKEYLKRYVGEVYIILSEQENIYIGPDFPNEFAGSAYTYTIKGANVKTKANAVQGIPEMTEIATGGNYKEVPILQYQCMVMMERWIIIMYSMLLY